MHSDCSFPYSDIQPPSLTIKEGTSSASVQYKAAVSGHGIPPNFPSAALIATNLDDDVKTIVEISSKRYKIEDCFRVMKTNFSARPVYHQNRERIIAHFMICYTALLIYRLLEAKLDALGTHFSIENVLETLKNMEVANVQDMYYLSLYNGSQVCTALNAIFNLGLDKKYYQPKDLNKKIKKIL